MLCSFSAIILESDLNLGPLRPYACRIPGASSLSRLALTVKRKYRNKEWNYKTKRNEDFKKKKTVPTAGVIPGCLQTFGGYISSNWQVITMFTQDNIWYSLLRKRAKEVPEPAMKPLDQYHL
jgi:hypothetical protein